MECICAVRGIDISLLLGAYTFYTIAVMITGRERECAGLLTGPVMNASVARSSVMDRCHASDADTLTWSVSVANGLAKEEK